MKPEEGHGLNKGVQIQNKWELIIPMSNDNNPIWFANFYIVVVKWPQ